MRLAEKHFQADEWVDFARGLIPEVKRLGMEAHLFSGCVKCRRQSDTLAGLVQAAATDAGYEVPGNLLGWAHAIPPRQPPQRPLEGARILARRLYDSFQDPLPVGARGGLRSRQALFEAGDFSLDLNVDKERGTSRMVLVGQIADRNEPDRPVAGVPVLLVRGRHVAARTVSNALGEFHFEYDPKEGLHLQIPLEGDKKIELPVPWFREARRRVTRITDTALGGEIPSAIRSAGRATVKIRKS